MGELNERQRVFARALAEGASQAAAYRKAFDCKGKSAAAVASNASRLAKNDKVREFVAQLGAAADARAVLGRQERMEWLSRLVEVAERSGEPAAVANGIRAVQELNRMDGAYAPERVEARVEECAFAQVLALMGRAKG